MVAHAAPDRGDIVWVSVQGRRGGGSQDLQRRPALVVSPQLYNKRSGLALMCAISQKARGYPFEVPLPEGLAVEGVVLADHLRSLDWRARECEVACKAPVSVVTDVLAKLKPL
jgi:mRNA interferase MazF